MLLSTTGVRISQHWCGDLLINATIWGEAEPCAHFKSQGESACPMHAQLTTSKNCCHQKAQIIEGGDEDFTIQYVTNPPQVLIGTLFWVDYIFDIISPNESIDPFRNHSPPLIESRLFALIQSFLL